MTSTIVSGKSLSCNTIATRAYVTTGKAAQYAGLCRNSIKALLDTGELTGFQTEGGHWRISTASLLSYVDGIEQESIVEETTEHKGVAIYARVSSHNQKQAGSLTRQIERLQKEVSEREGIDANVIPVYEDCASAFGNREQLNRLVDAMLDGQVKRIYCEYLDRLSRVPALTALIEHLAKRNGVEVVCLDVEETDPTEQDAWIKELISYITVVSNRVSAAKSRKVTVKQLSEATLSRLFALRNQGYSLTQVTALAKKEGLRTKDGEPLSYFKVRNTIYNSKGKAHAAALGLDSVYDPQKELRKWVAENMHETPEGETTEKGLVPRVKASEVTAAYRSHCKEQGYRPLNAGQIGSAITEVFGPRKFRTRGMVAYKRLALTN